VRVRDDDEGEVPKRLDAVRESSRQDRKRKVGRGEELLRRERRSSVSITRPLLASV
jgi:hypothetical protein